MGSSIYVRWGYKNFVSFIDDYSKFTWIYLLKFKSHVFQLFHEFHKLVERFFSRKIITMQTDWGGECQKLNSFKEISISHHMLCSHTHQQNGSEERKHRHNVKAGLCLLSQASMRFKYWDEVFLTVTYLINSLPSQVIQDDTPYHRVFKEKPNYRFLHAFG
jgi:hypothetical protein